MRSTLRRLMSILALAILGTTILVSPAAAEPAAEVGPQLLSVSLPRGPHAVGSTVEVTLGATHADELTEVAVILVETTTGHRHGLWLLGKPTVTAPGIVTVDWVVPSSDEQTPFNDVDYRVEYVTLARGQVYAYYWPDGRVFSPWADSADHDVDLDLSMSFTGSTRDVQAPILTSLTIPENELVANGRLRIDYAVTGDLSKITIVGSREGGAYAQLGFAWGFPIPSRGSTFETIDDVARLTIDRIDLTDLAGNHARYYPDGRLTLGSEVNPEAHTTTHTAFIEKDAVVARPGPASVWKTTALNGAVDLTWGQERDAGHRVVVSPGGRVITSPSTQDYAHSERVEGLANGTTYTFTITPTFAYGDGEPITTAATPRMSPLRVFGTGDRSRDGRADLWAAPPAKDSSTGLPESWRIYQGAGGGRFGRTLSSAIPVTKAPIPGSSTGRGPGAPLGALYLSGAELVEPTTTGTRTIGRGFDMFRTLDASSDLTSDGVADLIGITPAGDFYLYTSTAAGAIGRGVRLGGGWGAFQTVFSPGDFNGDARSDLVAVDGVGRLWLYPGTGLGGFRPRVQIGTGWAGFGSVFPMRDFSGDGRVDIGAITMDGRLFMYPGNGRGSFLAKSQIGAGWGMFL